MSVIILLGGVGRVGRVGGIGVQTPPAGVGSIGNIIHVS